MSGANDVAMADPDGLVDAPPPASSGYAVADPMATDTNSVLSGEKDTIGVTDEALIERFLKVVASGSDLPTSSGERGIGGTALVKHCLRVKATINTIYEMPGVTICRSPERPDLQLSMEEAYGRCVVDLIVGPTDLLSPELRQIGKNVDNYASREKRSHDNAKEKAKDKRKNARAAARNNEAKAAALDETLAAIETDLEAKRVERLAKPAALDLPDPKTVVVDGPAPVHWRTKQAERQAAEATVLEAEEAAEEAAADAIAADANYSLAAVKAERAAKALERLPGSERSAQQWLSYCLAIGEEKPSEAEQKRRDAAYERCFAARLKVAETLGAAEKAEREAARAKRLAASSAGLARVEREAFEAIAAIERAHARVKETAAAVEGPNARVADLEAQLAAIRMRERRLYGEV